MKQRSEVKDTPAFSERGLEELSVVTVGGGESLPHVCFAFVVLSAWSASVKRKLCSSFQSISKDYDSVAKVDIKDTDFFFAL